VAAEPINPPSLMTPQDLSEHLGVPVATLYGWRYNGYGPPGFRVGKHLRWRRSDVERWIDQQAGREHDGRGA
jgi:predicted DNA-binding transcriptional regulator AlpA